MWPFRKKEESSMVDIADYNDILKHESKHYRETIKPLEETIRKLNIENMALNYRKEDLKKSANLYPQRAKEEIDSRSCFTALNWGHHAQPGLFDGMEWNGMQSNIQNRMQLTPWWK